MKPKNRRPTAKKLRAGLVFPVRRVRTVMRRDHYADNIGTAAAIYLSSVLEYLTRLVLSKSAEKLIARRRNRIEPKLIIEAIMKDSELLRLWDGVIVSETSLQEYLATRG